MKTFKDNQDRKWTVTINVSAIKRVRAELDLDLLEAIEGTLLERMVSDPILLCDILYVLVKPEADAKGISDEDFGRAMAGDAIDRACQAFIGELVDFFPTGRREVLAQAVAKVRQIEAKVCDRAMARLQGAEVDDLIERALTEAEPQPPEPPRPGG